MKRVLPLAVLLAALLKEPRAARTSIDAFEGSGDLEAEVADAAQEEAGESHDEAAMGADVYADADQNPERQAKNIQKKLAKFMESIPDGCYPKTGKWAAVCAKLSKHDFPFSFTVGNKRQMKFTFFSEGRLPIIPDDARSMSKWYSATAIAGVVARKIYRLKFDDLANKWFSWWTKDPNDRRSKITLKHLLTFTSGFQAGAESEPPCIQLGGMGPINPASNPMTLVSRMNYTIEQCAKQIYEQHPMVAEPGKLFAYTNSHLQVALAMAVKATRIPARLLFQRFLFVPAGMRFTMFEAGGGFFNPLAGGGALTPIIDLDAFARAYLRKTWLPASSVIKEMDKNWIAEFGASMSWGGSFGMGHQPLKAYSGLVQGHDIQYWGGGSAGKIIIDRTAGVYMTYMTGYAWDPRTESGKDVPKDVLPEVYGAMAAKM